jgi:hypothetical protein
MKKLIRENLESEIDFIGSYYIILKPNNVVENQFLSLINKVIIDKRLLY